MLAYYSLCDVGFRDINSILRVGGGGSGGGGGLLCELQLILTPFEKLKEVQHPSYEIARSLGLVGPLPGSEAQQQQQGSTDAGATVVQVPRTVRVALAVLRLATLAVSLIMGFHYYSTWLITIYPGLFLGLCGVSSDQLYPPVPPSASPLCSPRPRENSCQTTALCDAANDFLYVSSSLPLLWTSETSAVVLSIDWLTYLSNIMPLLHIMTLARAIEISAADKNSSQPPESSAAAVGGGGIEMTQPMGDTSVEELAATPGVTKKQTDAHSGGGDESGMRWRELLWSASSVDVRGRRLVPRSVLASYLIVSLGFVLVTIFVTCKNGYPFQATIRLLSMPRKTTGKNRTVSTTALIFHFHWELKLMNPTTHQACMHTRTILHGPMEQGAVKRNIPVAEDVSLGGNSLTGSCRVRLGRWRNSELPDLSSNRITGSLPSQVGDGQPGVIGSLVQQLHGPPLPSEIGEMDNLYSLDLYSNSFTGSLPSQIGEMDNLYSLHLSSNSFTGSSSEEIGEMENLKSLHLSSNSFTGSLPRQIGEMDIQLLLDLSSNSFTGSLPSQIGEMDNLESLDLYNNTSGSSLPTELGSLTKLTSLHLDDNSFCGDMPTELAALFEDIECTDDGWKNPCRTWPSPFTFSGNSIGTGCN